MNPSVNASQGVVLDTVPREVRMLAESLSRLHGPSVIRNESNGYHIYLPCPECLLTDGRKELHSKHLTVNASRYKQLEDWTGKHGLLDEEYARDFSAVCHKNDIRFKVTDLLNERIYQTLDKRGIKDVNSHVASASTVRYECLIDDGKGNMVPQDPGEVIPLSSLPSQHPAILYLQDRNYSIETLESQFNCGYCETEAPENSTKGIYYKKLPLDFKDTSQGRIIFYAYINNVQVGWQARIIDRVINGNIKQYWHPYKKIWINVEYKQNGKWCVLPGVETKQYNIERIWKPSKYKTAFGMPKNEVLMGVDAAVQFNKIMALKKPTAFIVEGPLDAGRIGPGGIAMLGKYLSDSQANILVRKFKRLIMVMDNDAAGVSAKLRIQKVMQDKAVDIIFAEVPSAYKDIGEMAQKDATNFAYSYLI